MIHIYTGDGKGKTTAAVGQAVRAAGNGLQVLFVQFLKDGTSGEIGILKGIPQITVDYVSKNYGFYKNMTEEDKKSAREAYGALLSRNLKKVQQMEKQLTAGDSPGLLVILDEIAGAYHHELIDRKQLLEFLIAAAKQSFVEVILTGRNPGRELTELADYITEMKKIAHPVDKGVYARKGIEY